MWNGYLWSQILHTKTHFKCCPSSIWWWWSHFASLNKGFADYCIIITIGFALIRHWIIYYTYLFHSHHIYKKTAKEKFQVLTTKNIYVCSLFILLSVYFSWNKYILCNHSMISLRCWDNLSPNRRANRKKRQWQY